MGNPKEAKEILLKVIEIDEKIYNYKHPRLAVDYSNLATIEQDLENFDDAKKLIKRAISIGEEIYPSELPNLGLFYAILALTEQALGNLKEAEPLMRKAVEIKSKVFGRNYPKIANVLVNLSRLLLELGQLQEAEQLAKEAMVLWEESENPTDWRLGKAYWILGILEGYNDNFNIAIEHLEKALKFLHKGRGDNHLWILFRRKGTGKIEIRKSRLN